MKSRYPVGYWVAVKGLEKPVQIAKWVSENTFLTAITERGGIATQFVFHAGAILYEVKRKVTWEKVEPNEPGKPDRYGLLKELTDEDNKEIYKAVMKRSDEIIRGEDE